MSSEPGVSSYDKIFGHLAKCPEFKDVRASWAQRLSAVRFDRYEFQYLQVYRNGQNIKEVAVTFLATDGHKAYVTKDDRGCERISYGVNDEFLLTDDEAKRVVDVNFGTKRCKTYFCKVEKVLKGDERKNHVRPGFAEWARKKLKAETEGQVVEAQARVVAEVEAARQSPQYAADRKRFFERQVIEEIKAVVLQYYDAVDASVIKEALDECVAHAVMES